MTYAVRLATTHGKMSGSSCNPIREVRMPSLKTVQSGLTILVMTILVMTIASIGSTQASSDTFPVPSGKARALIIVAQSEQCQVSGKIATVTAPTDGKCLCPSGTLRAGERPLGPLGSGKYFCSPIW